MELEKGDIKQCVFCFKTLTGNQLKYCGSDNCKQQHRQLQKKFKELKKKNPNLELIFWKSKIKHLKDNSGEKIEWRKIKGVENKPSYKIIKNVVTKRKPKST